MGFRVSPAWWPILAVISPGMIPWLAVRSRRFRRGQLRAAQVNAERIERASPLDLPALQSLELTVVVEQRQTAGFLGDAAVSYWFRTDRGSLLMDVGHGPDTPTFAHNTRRLGLRLEELDALLISHLHLDHMGGQRAMRAGRVTLPVELLPKTPKPCYVPAECAGYGLQVHRLDRPQGLEAGLASTGPLARMLFYHGWMEEQAVMARLQGKGLAVFTGCGHMTVELLLAMVRRLSSEPLFALGGGLHFPVTRSRTMRYGVQLQQVFGTGKHWRQRITDEDLTRAIQAINQAGPRRVYLSAHDTCDYALRRLSNELDAEVEVLHAGSAYRL
jgi:7,8-dihydropterin-6-yl-methyl-4-(beta-D-ribofuranosyl)aminobenzene 5'-phosphate synthase